MRLLFALSLSALAFLQAQTPPQVSSPDGSIQLVLSADGGQLVYTVSLRGKPVIARSVLGLDIQDQQPLGAAVNITGVQASKVDETYSLPHGKANPIRNQANSVTVG